MELYVRGAALNVWRVEEAVTTWNQAVGSVASQKRDAQVEQLDARLSVLALRGHLRSPDHMNSEGDGIFAVKTNGGLRAYGWFGSVEGTKSFIVCHVALKKRQKLTAKDFERAKKVKERYSSVVLR